MVGDKLVLLFSRILIVQFGHDWNKEEHITPWVGFFGTIINIL
jgi:hypothetical protein